MSANFDEFRENVLFNSSPISSEDVEAKIKEINDNAHKSDLFTDQIKSYITDIPIFSVNTSKLFAIKYIEEYHRWLTENFNITPKE